MNAAEDGAEIAHDVVGLVTGRSWLKLALCAIGAIAAALVLYVAFDRLSGHQAARSHGEAVTAQETGNAAAATGAEAVNTVTRTYEYHTQVDHIVKEGQANVDRQESVEAADNAAAAALCGLHHDLCRDRPAAAP